MNGRNKVNSKSKLPAFIAKPFLILTILLCGISGYSQIKSLPANKDSVSNNLPTITASKGSVKNTSTNALIDTLPKIDTLQLKISKDSLQGPVNYKAEDSLVMDVPAKKMYLYGKITNISYLDNILAAPKIEFDQETSLVTASLVKDSLGKVISFAEVSQGETKSKSDTIIFNLKTLRGITKGTYTQQGEMYIYAERLKKASPDVFFGLNSRFTTCNLDTPHFAFVARKVKFVTKKWAYTGPVHPEFEGVPIPIALPFGIFPLKQGVRSGLLAPTFNANDQFGLSLENLGYYKVFNDHLDAQVYGTIYSYGGWAAELVPRYFKRYKYQGSMRLSFRKTKILDEPRQQ